jgi:3-oxoacyl-[acyl-carrier protein] reductase
LDKTVLITGGSGALGRALVRHFSESNYRVFFSYNKNKDKAEKLVQETGAISLCVDLTIREQVETMSEKIFNQVSFVDVLVNNAGATQIMPFALIEEEDWDQMINANLKSLFFATQAMAKGMIAKKSGVIVNIGSIAGRRLLEVPVHYATAKAAVHGFTLSLAREFARYNIRINTVVPGMLSEGIGRLVPEKQKEEYLKYCAAGRPGEMSEVASLVGFLASEAASYINAQEIIVDGGL